MSQLRCRDRFLRRKRGQIMFGNLNKILSSEYLLGKPEGFKYLAFFLVIYFLITLGAIAFNIIFRFKFRGKRVYSSFRKMIYWGNLSVGFFGGFLVFARQQELPLFSLRIFNYLLLLFFAVFNISLFIYYKKTVLKRAKKEFEKKRIEKWLPKSKGS